MAQIVAARDPERLRSLTLTDCDTHDRVPPKAFLPTVLLARTGLLAPIGRLLVRRGLAGDPGRLRRRLFGTTYQDPTHLAPAVSTRVACPSRTTL